jgi:hypothetical protein
MGVGGCSRILLTSNPISGPRSAGFAWVAAARSRRRMHELISESVWLAGTGRIVICCGKGVVVGMAKGVWRGRRRRRCSCSPDLRIGTRTG